MSSQGVPLGLAAKQYETGVIVLVVLNVLGHNNAIIGAGG